MVALIVDSLILLCAITLISDMMAFCEAHKYNAEAKRHMLWLGIAFLASVAFNVLSNLSYGSKFCYIFFGLGRFTSYVFIASLVLICENVIALPGKIITYFITFLCYTGLGLYFVDTLISEGKVSQSEYGVYINISNPLHMSLYLLIYSVYIIIFVTFVAFRANTAVKKREKLEIELLGLTFASCTIGFLSELMMSIRGYGYYELSIPLNLLTLFFVYRLSKYHRSIQIIPEDFEIELAPNRTDIVFVVDDTLKIVLQGKRAEVHGILSDEKYLGKQINKLFEFLDEDFDNVINDKSGIPFGTTAYYPKGDKEVKLVFKHNFDVYGELISSIVNVYDMEPEENHFYQTGFKQEGSTGDIINEKDIVDRIRSKKILIVDEDIHVLKQFEEILSSYEVKITKAIGGKDAFEHILNGNYDLIVLSDGMITMSSQEICSRVRSYKEDYYKNVPIILVTSRNMNEVYKEVLDSGFTDYIYRPIKKENVRDMLIRWIWRK